MSAYDQFLKETKKTTPSTTPKITPPSVGDSSQPATPALSAYDRFKQETSGKQVLTTTTEAPKEKKAPLLDRINEKGERIGVSMNAGIVQGIGGLLKGLNWVGDRLSGGDRIVGEANEKLLQSRIDAQTKTIELLNKAKAEGNEKQKKKLNDLLQKQSKELAEGIVFTNDTTDTAPIGKAGNFLNKTGQNWKAIAGITPENQSFVEKVFEGAGSSAVYFIPAVGVARGARALSFISPKLAMMFGGSASATLEAMAEAGQTFEEVKKTQGLDKAKEASTKTFWANAILLALTERLGVFNPNVTGALKKALISMPVEGFQESAQQLISNVNADRPVWEGVGESGLIGSIIGGVMGGTVDFATGGNKPVQLPPSEKTNIQETPKVEAGSAYEKFLKEGGKPSQDLSKPSAELQKELETTQVSPTPLSTQEGAKTSETTPVKGKGSATPQVDLKIPTLKEAQDLIQKEGGFANASSLPAKNAYASAQLATSLSLNEEFLYNNATKKGIKLEEWLNRLDTETDATKRVAIGGELMDLLSAKEVKVPKAKTEKNVIRGEEVSQKLKEFGSDGGVSDFLLDQVKKQNYVQKTISIDKLLAEDPDLQEYIENSKGKIRKYKGAKNPDAPIIVSAKEGRSDVLDGYNRIARAIKDGKKEITGYLSTEVKEKKTPKKTKLPKTGSIGSSIGRFREEGDIRLGHFDQIKPIEFPELLEFAKELSGSDVFVKKFRTANGKFYGKNASIGLNTDLFKKDNLQQLQKTMAHEIGHLIDYLPEGTLARGNTLGRLAVLKGFHKDFFAGAGATRTNKEVTEQLWELSKYWKPIDEATAPKAFLQYRKSSAEIYADFISVLFNNPKLAGEIAPTAYNIFFEQLDKKPDVKKAYFELQDFLRNGEKVVEARRDKVQNMFTVADQTAKERQNQLELEAEQKKKSLWFLFKFQNVSRFEAIRERVKEQEKKGEYVNPDENPVYFLEESNYLGGKIKAVIDQRFNSIYEELQNNGMTWDDLGEIAFYERILKGDRGEVANPEGMQIDFVQELYDGFTGVQPDPTNSERGTKSMRSQLGDEKFNRLKQLAQQYRDAIKDLYIDAHKEGIISDQSIKMIKESDYYVPFKPIKYAGNKTSYTIKNKKGTLQPIENPANTGIEKVVSLIRAMERNKVNQKTIQFLEKNFPSDLQEAKYAFNGKQRIALEPLDKNMRLVSYMEKGKMKSYYVDQYIGEAMKKTTVGGNNMMIEGLRFLNSGLFRPMFITFNLGFQSFNLIRDMTRFWKNIPNMSLLKTMRLYAKSARGAKIRAFGLPKNPSKADKEAYDLINKLEEDRILALTYNDIIKGEDIEDRQIDKIMREVGVRETKATKLGTLGSTFGLTKNTPIIKQALGIMSFIEKTGNLIETMPKIAGYYALEGKMPPREMRSFIRRKVGSPDFLDGGKFKPVINEIFLFSNAIFQGIRADYEVATDPKTRSGYWWKTTQATLLPKILMALATAGLFGEYLKELFGKVSEYDKTNYTIIPIGKDENGKAIYVRIPQDETGRLIGGIIWKLAGITQDPEKLGDLDTYTNLLSYAGGQAPSVSPSITALYNVSSFVSGQNPYDFFRARPVLTDDQMLAGGWEKTKPFLAYMFENLGGSLFVKLYYNETVPKDPSLSERIVSLPIASNVAGRFVKVSDYGEKEKIKEITTEIRSENAREQIKNRRKIFEYVQQSQDLAPNEVNKLKKEMVKDLFDGEIPKTKEDRQKAQTYEKRFDTLRIRGTADARIDSLMIAQSNEEKVALLMEFSQSMKKEDFDELRKFIIKNRVVSGEAYRQFLQTNSSNK